MPDGTRIRLAPGSHSSPREGVCVVELASVLAAEKFSDRPRCVCPVVGAFLRGWNDRAPHAERQRLAPYAALIVGSRQSSQVTRERRDICLAWAGADLTRGGARRLLSRLDMRIRIAIFCGLGAAIRLSEGAGEYASRIASARRDPQSAFELLDTLLAVGQRQRPGGRIASNGNGRPANGRPAAASPNGRPPLNGNGSSPNGSSPHEATPSVSAQPSPRP